MTQREEFETFWKENMNVELLPLHRTHYPFTPDCDQQYLCHETNRSWFTWQAAKAQAVPQWISVGYRLPKYGDDCLIVAEGKSEPENLVYEFTKNKFSSDDQFVSIPSGEDYFYARNVSHWMPLPSAPEQVKDGE